MKTSIGANQVLFLKSAISYDNPFISTAGVLKWIGDQNQKIKVNVEQVPFKNLSGWSFSQNHESLSHETGNFFSIEGIHIRAKDSQHKQSWDQPIISQSEIGYLGFLVKEFDGVLYFLMQAKIEPGNINGVQLSPTLQATRSNYSQVHKGRKPEYLDYFVSAQKNQILLDQLQSEQGSRFLRKRNRNIIVKIEEDIEVKEGFAWLTLGQIKLLMSKDNIINMDTRTVMLGITFFEGTSTLDLDSVLSQKSSLKILESYCDTQNNLHSISDIISFITRLKCLYELQVLSKPLSSLEEWAVGDWAIERDDKKYFRVMGASISIENREVSRWCQPMIEPSQEGLCAFVCKEINGVLHFIVQAKLECGNFDIIELAPTVQCLTGNYRNPGSISKLPFLEYVLTASDEKIILNSLQSEEGGRFYREQNRNILVKADASFPEELPENYIWMTLNQLQTFIRFNNYINIQARSLLSALKLVQETHE